jgi:arylsulfatase A-like enzyme/Tfp pilus assembly protein PilF
MAKNTRRIRPPSSPAPTRPAGRSGWSARWPAALAAVGLLAAAAGGWWWLARPAPLEFVRTANQNVLLITLDTVRADALGCYGGQAETPNLDRLAGGGVRFDFAHAHAVLTLPSHVSILSGLYPFQHGVRDNSGFRVRPGMAMVATLLKGKGFATAAFIGGYPLDSQFGLDQGFDVYDDRLDDVGQTSQFVLAERRADAVVGSAMTWLTGQRSPWFAWVHVFDPHAAYKPPEPYASRYRSNPYAGEVAFADAALGPLLDKVRMASDRPTLVIVTGDHGEGLGDHGEATHGVFAYEATLRIPLIVAQVGGASGAGRSNGGGRVSSAPVQHVDILPTILDGLGVPSPPAAHGESLLKEVPDADARASYFEALAASLNRGWAPLTGVLVGRNKYIDLPVQELYDLAGDPAEARNDAESRAPVRRTLHARLGSLGPTAPGPRQSEDPETLARLRSLGYTAGASAAARKTYTEGDDPKRLVGLDQEIQRGLELYQAGRVREAEAVFRSLVARRPDMTLSYLHLGFLLWEQGRGADAIATLRRAREVGAADSEVEWRLGMYLSETGQLREAIPLLEAEAGRPDPSVDALNALGIAYDRAGRTAAALETFQRILALDARNAMAWQNTGAAYLHAGNTEAARLAFSQSIEANPKWAASYTGLGVVELARNNRQGAIGAWKRAVELNPREFDALFNLATELINDRQNDAARVYVQQFVATAPPAAYAKDIARLRAWLGPGGM